MSTRRDEIDAEIEHLRKLASQLTDQRTLEGIKGLIADLEGEKATLSEKE
jgi:hypothetical protein